MKIHLFLLLHIWSLTGTAQAPSPRWIVNMAYDDNNQQLLVFGGGTDSGIATDLWSYKDSKWKKLADNGPKLIKSTMVYDIDRKRLLFFGGNGADDISQNETWEWDGKTWTKKHVPAPPARNHVMGVYDKKNKRVLIFGGFGSGGALSDTWSYDGEKWKQLKADGSMNYLAQGMVYDEVRDKPVLIGCSLGNDYKDHKLNEMWEWNGSDWVKINNSKLLTSPQSLQALAIFQKQQIVLFDGDDISNGNGRTWTYSTGGWSSASLPGPSPRVGHVMAYDKARNRTILFGGSDRKKLFNDVWEWDGKQWKELLVN